MLRIELSDALTQRQSRCPNVPDDRLLGRLPFPVAYAVAAARSEGYEWTSLISGVLHAILKFLAVVGVSDYVHGTTGPDFDINDELRKLVRPLGEGHWLGILRACSAKRADLCVVPGFAASVALADDPSSLWVRIVDERRALDSGELGLFSGLVYLRNKLHGHGVSLSPEEKAEAARLVLPLVHVLLQILDPVWDSRLVARVPLRARTVPLVLTGIEDFAIAQEPKLDPSCQMWIDLPDGEALALHPIGIVDVEPQTPTIERRADVYLLSYVRARAPVYYGLGGRSPKREDLASTVNRLLDTKRVFVRRRDIEIGRVLDYSAKVAREQFEEYEQNNIYEPSRFVPRPTLTGLLDSFLADNDCRALLLAGESGNGKTAATLSWLNGLLERGVPVIPLRAVELPTKCAFFKDLERWLCQELGYAGTLGEILERAASAPSGRLVLAIDGLNEFLAPGRDATALFDAINQLLIRYSDFSALKVILTTRLDSIEAFLPGGRLPAQADSRVYYRPGTADFSEVGVFTREEATAAFLLFGTPQALVDEAMQRHADLLRRPDCLKKFAQGVVSLREARRLSRRGLTSRFLAKRVGRDRALERSLVRLTEIMGKERDLSIGLDRLEEVDPRLFRKLTKRNNELLDKARDLRLLSWLRGEDLTGRPAWRLSLSHSSLFEALVLRLKRQRLLNHLKFVAQKFIFGTVLVGGLCWMLSYLGVSGIPVSAFVSLLVFLVLFQFSADAFLAGANGIEAILRGGQKERDPRIAYYGLAAAHGDFWIQLAGVAISLAIVLSIIPSLASTDLMQGLRRVILGLALGGTATQAFLLAHHARRSNPFVRMAFFRDSSPLDLVRHLAIAAGGLAAMGGYLHSVPNLVVAVLDHFARLDHRIVLNGGDLAALLPPGFVASLANQDVAFSWLSEWSRLIYQKEQSSWYRSAADLYIFSSVVILTMITVIWVVNVALGRFLRPPSSGDFQSVRSIKGKGENHA